MWGESVSVSYLQLYVKPFCVLSNILLYSCFCDLPITLRAVPTILESLFKLFTIKLPYYAVILIL